MKTLTVAETIWEQMGGSRAGMMIGVKHLVGDVDSLAVRFNAKARNKANHVSVKLEADDTYTVTFYRIPRGGLDPKVVSEHPMVYADSLRSLFTSETGLYLSM